MSEALQDSYNAILKAYDALKFQLNDDHFRFQVSNMSPHISVVDLNCEEEHEELVKLYGIFYSIENQSYSMIFESSLAYKSTFCREHAAKLINEDIDFEIYKQRLRLKKENVALEDLAAYVKIMSEILFNF